LSKVVKSHRLILDDQAYQLAPRIIIPVETVEESEYEAEEEIDHEETIQQKIHRADREIQARHAETEDEIRELLAAVEQDREKMLQEAFDQARDVLEKAREQGHEEGRQAGFDEGRSIAESLIQEALAVKAELFLRRDKLVREIEEESVRLIIDTAERILNKHIQEDYDLIQGIVKSAMGKVTYTESVTLRVSAEDHDMAVSLKDQILALAENVDDIIIKPDKSLRPGSCVLDTTSGSIDSSIWTQFEQIKNTFEELLGSE